MIASLDTAKVLICAGSGGVGKTTIAAALGFLAAKRGRRVLVLTIDPSQRLKTTLNLSESGEVSVLNHPDIRGKFSAALIDPKKTFDDFVRRAAKQEAVVQKVINNKLYRQLSTTLSGSQEFTALEKLFSCYESGEYDLIILDTPPTKHAIDFLKAPQKLSAIFNEGIAKWFRRDESGASLVSQIFNVGTRQVLRALESLTGSEFMRELSDFFQNMQTWQSKLEERIHSMHRLLVSPDTHFCLITSFDQAKLREAAYFAKEIRKGGYSLSSVVINRAMPSWLLRIPENKRQPSHKGELESQFLELEKYYQERDSYYRSFANSLILEMNQQNIVFRIPEFDQDISNILEVAELAAMIETGGSI